MEPMRLYIFTRLLSYKCFVVSIQSWAKGSKDDPSTNLLYIRVRQVRYYFLHVRVL